MPGNILNTLYPPQINTFMPAFVNTQDAYVYFSLSPYNDTTEIKRVHISVTNQLTNDNVLNDASGILITDLMLNENTGMSYVVIPYSSIKNGWGINQFYKVQIRFDSYEGDAYKEGMSSSLLNSYLIDYRAYFSEWSSVCLIRPILQPNIKLRTFDTYNGENTIGFNKGIMPISGICYFGESNVTEETETLQSYQIKIFYKSDLTTPVLETDKIYTGLNIDPNDINYKIDLQGIPTDSETEFVMRIYLITKNQYSFVSKDYEFQIIEYIEDDAFKPSLELNVNNEEGIASLHIQNIQSVFGTLYVKRASSVDNFKTWENIYVNNFSGPIDLTIEDNTIGSLIWYRYSVQMANSKGALTNAYRTEKILPEFYDVILSRGKKQLKIQYNYKISSFKPVVNRSKKDTLGGKYPKFSENAVLNYKQFSISGLISSQEDENELFLKKSNHFGDEYNNYLVYKENNQVSDYYDYFWEREFREEVMSWLNDGEPKLYRSTTEGIICVMLTDLSLTPNTTLDRRIWDFSATVYEIADGMSLNTLDELGIYDVPNIEEDYSGGTGPGPEYTTIYKVGQLYQHKIENNNDVIGNIILPNLKQKYGGVLTDKVPKDGFIKNVRLYFHNKPHAYLEREYGIQCVDNQPASNFTEDEWNRIQLGYVFELTTSTSKGRNVIFVNSKGYYQIPEDIDVTGLYIQQSGDIVTIEYILVYEEALNDSIIISGNSVDRTVIGQETGIYKPNVYLGEKIRAKYNFVKTDEFYQRMQYWKGTCVDVTPFAVLHLMYQGEKEYHDYLVGETGVLHLLKDYKIQDMCFLGKKLKQVDQKRQRFLEHWEYVLDENNYSSINDIKEPKLNTVYNIEDNFKIYYQNQWFDFDKDSEIAEIPIEGMINYIGDVIRSDY